MKTILIPTDLSPAADNAARYALRLATSLKTDVKLFNAVKVPAEAHMAAQVAWPLEDYQTIKTDVEHELRIFAERLLLELQEQNDLHTMYSPNITYCCGVGPVPDAVRSLTSDHAIGMIAMGTHATNGLTRFFAGSTSRDMIDKTDVPLLLIPSTARFKPLKTIAFATDLSADDVVKIHSLASLARVFNAEILLVHVMDGETRHKGYQQKISDFLSHVCDTANYPHIYYRDVKEKEVDLGLTWLLEHRDIDILAMVHRKHDLLDRLFDQSHTQHMARNTDMPLLVFPDTDRSIVF